MQGLIENHYAKVLLEVISLYLHKFIKDFKVWDIFKRNFWLRSPLSRMVVLLNPLEGLSFIWLGYLTDNIV